jgi:hypothetical protein
VHLCANIYNALIERRIIKRHPDPFLREVVADEIALFLVGARDKRTVPFRRAMPRCLTIP